MKISRHIYYYESFNVDLQSQQSFMYFFYIPGAKNIPWITDVNADGTFKSADKLATLYQSEGVTPDKDIITYCRIGERSAFTWFVLTQLLGYDHVQNYDGSWTEWGSLVRAPIEKP